MRKKSAIKSDNKSEAASPVYVVCGFLGSGKTTLLIRLLSHFLDRGVRPSVLMNEFGEIDIDGKLMEQAGPRSRNLVLEKVLGGCLCCDAKEGLEDALVKLLQRAPGQPVVVETTGLAVSGSVSATVEKTLAGLPADGPRGRLARVIGLVDAPRFISLAAFWPAAPYHLLGANVVVVNKMDLLAKEEEETLFGVLEKSAPAARLLPAVHAEVNMDELLTGKTRGLPPINDFRGDSTAGYRSAGFNVLARVDLARLQALLDRHRRSVVRAKGFLRVPGFPEMQEIQWAGGLLNFQNASGRQKSQLVVIGRRVPWTGFMEGLDACALSPQPSGRKKV
ncbi:MAG: GTP-binding protein [Elusimicrobia bacterium]|nr:GTP-binding protein [Elusimicrobiota bacterium]